MKQCPTCKTTYTDDTLSYCLADGSGLTEIGDEEPTVVRTASDKARVTIPQRADRTVVQERVSGGKSSNGLIKVVIGVAVIGLLLLIGLGLAGVGLYYGTGRRSAENITPTPTAPPPATATPDKEKEKLRDELANIQKQLDEQRRNANRADKTDEERGSSITATVDSPNDGFLALRSEPDADNGDRIAKIPNGAEIEVLRCGGGTVTIGSRKGRWCYVEYNGQTGWVFDAWLSY